MVLGGGAYSSIRELRPWRAHAGRALARRVQAHLDHITDHIGCGGAGSASDFQTVIEAIPVTVGIIRVSE